ncbi:MAG: C-GCAxxG-C-C family protein [Thermodesulfobacteriota bacterium]
MIQILGEDLNFDRDQAARMATPFGGGVARLGTICGALIGGAMALGFCYGRTQAEEKERKEKTYKKVQEMLREFEEDFGTIQCKNLIQLNLLDPTDRQKFQEMKLINRCSRFVAKSVESARRLLREK